MLLMHSPWKLCLPGHMVSAQNNLVLNNHPLSWQEQWQPWLIGKRNGFTVTWEHLLPWSSPPDTLPLHLRVITDNAKLTANSAEIDHLYVSRCLHLPNITSRSTLPSRTKGCYWLHIRGTLSAFFLNLDPDATHLNDVSATFDDSSYLYLHRFAPHHGA